MAVTTVRPNNTYSGAANFDLTGGGTKYGALADDSDATYLRKATTATGAYVMECGTFTLTGSQKIKRVRVRARASTPTSAGDIGIKLGVRVDGVNYYGSVLALKGTNTLGEYVGGYASTAPDGAEWDQTRLNSLKLRLIDNATGSDRGYVYELYADVDVANQPTVTVSAPTGTITTTSQPTVTWTYSDTDGDTQGYYEVRVFTAAQYGVAGFDPDVSTCTWESGETSSDESEVTVGEYLSNATYRAYVRVGKSISGAAFWSAWAFSGFVVNLSPPSVPTLSATYSETYNRVSVAIDGQNTLVGLDYQEFELQRSLTGSSGWAVVRDGGAISPGANGDATVVDYDAPRGVTVYYRVRAVGYLGTDPYASAWSSNASVAVTNDGEWWFKAIGSPTLNLGGIQILAGVEEQVEEDLGVFRPIGRSTALVVSGALSGRDGNYTILTTTTSEWNSIYALATHQGVVLIQDPVGDQKYVRFVSRQWKTTGATSSLRREVTLGYVEASGD